MPMLTLVSPASTLCKVERDVKARSATTAVGVDGHHECPSQACATRAALQREDYAASAFVTFALQIDRICSTKLTIFPKADQAEACRTEAAVPTWRNDDRRHCAQPTHRVQPQTTDEPRRAIILPTRRNSDNCPVEHTLGLPMKRWRTIDGTQPGRWSLCGIRKRSAPRLPRPIIKWSGLWTRTMPYRAFARQTEEILFGASGRATPQRQLIQPQRPLLSPTKSA